MNKSCIESVTNGRANGWIKQMGSDSTVTSSPAAMEMDSAERENRTVMGHMTQLY